MIEQDKETREALLEGQKAERLSASEDWKWAKEKLFDIVGLVLSLETLTEFKTATALQLEISARKKAAGMIKTWVEMVEGLGEQSKYNQVKKEDDSYIVRKE